MRCWIWFLLEKGQRSLFQEGLGLSNEVADVSTLWVGDCLRVGRSERIASDLHVVVHVRDWIYEDSSLWEGENDSVILRLKNSYLLAIYNACCLVSILHENDMHLFVGKDGVGVGNGSTRDVTDGPSRE